MNAIGGHCGKCGAPYYVPSVWHGITPPTPTPTCACWNVPKTTTWTSISTTVHTTVEEMEADRKAGKLSYTAPQPDIAICMRCREHAGFVDGLSECCGVRAYVNE